jgi:hypothetical protein
MIPYLQATTSRVSLGELEVKTSTYLSFITDNSVTAGVNIRVF